VRIAATSVTTALRAIGSRTGEIVAKISATHAKIVSTVTRIVAIGARSVAIAGE
jgi:hypothetical protein